MFVNVDAATVTSVHMWALDCGNSNECCTASRKVVSVFVVKALFVKGLKRPRTLISNDSLVLEFSQCMFPHASVRRHLLAPTDTGIVSGSIGALFLAPTSTVSLHYL